MPWSIGGVTLPNNPKRTTITYKANTKIIDVPGGKPIIISMGRQVDKLQITGTLVDGTKTRLQMHDTYLEPYRDMVWDQTVAIDTNDVANFDFINDTDWIMTSCTFTENGGYTLSWGYTMEFILGSNQEVIS